MYEHFSFTNGIQTKVFTDMNQALEEAATLVVNPVDATVGDIKITPDGLIDLGGDKRKITMKGFESYCKILGIPPSFARTIPEDLLLHNIFLLACNLLCFLCNLKQELSLSTVNDIRKAQKYLPLHFAFF